MPDAAEDLALIVKAAREAGELALRLRAAGLETQFKDGGSPVTNADLAGHPYVMNVWGSWCPECRVEHPILTKFALTKRVRFIGYNLKDERPDALRWLEQFGNPYMMVLADVEGRTAIDWGIYGAPETFLVDGNGVIRWKHVGAIDQAIIDHQLIPALEKIEAGR